MLFCAAHEIGNYQEKNKAHTLHVFEIYMYKCLYRKILSLNYKSVLTNESDINNVTQFRIQAYFKLKSELF